MNPRSTTSTAASALLSALLSGACGHAGAEPEESSHGDFAPSTGAAQVAAASALEIHVPPPPLSEGVFPCSDCHEPDALPPNPKRRELKLAHQEIELEHDQEHRWCLDCHDADDRDHLRLASGEKVPFEESYRLCGQCHGDKYRDWRAGVHGRRTGHWDGEKQYQLCVHCHNSHSPKFQPLEPEPPPRRPKKTP